MINSVTILDNIGTFAFAISGIRLAALKKFDWFGAYVVGLVTAIGGGTMRDVLLNTSPFWMNQASYLICTALALLSVIILGNHIIKFKHTFFIFDTIGLGLFVVVGINKTLAFGFPMWVAIFMGTLTGSAGGVIRDILINEVPLIFHKEIYAMACVLGGLIYWACYYFGVEATLTQMLSASGVILSRFLAVKYKIALPQLRNIG